MRRGRRRHTPSKWITVLLFVLFAMGIGYAAISTTLEIDGTSDIDRASWDVHFANVHVTSGSVTASTPTITDDTTVAFSATLANPGDFYEFTVDIVNAGTLNAKINSINILPVLTQEQANYFKYDVVYSDNTSINQNDPLNAGVTETIKIRFEYKSLGNTSLYPADDVNFDFSVSIDYIQGNGNSINGDIFTVSNDDTSQIGSHFPPNLQFYNNYQSAINSFGHDFFVKSVVSNNIVMESYIGFVLNNNVYYIRGGDESDYDNNKNLLNNAFGISNCDEYIDAETQYDCQAGDIIIECYSNGDIMIYDYYANCVITQSGGFGCLSY